MHWATLIIQCSSEAKGFLEDFTPPVSLKKEITKSNNYISLCIIKIALTYGLIRQLWDIVVSLSGNSIMLPNTAPGDCTMYSLNVLHLLYPWTWICCKLIWLTTAGPVVKPLLCHLILYFRGVHSKLASLQHNTARGDFNIKPCEISMHNDPEILFPDRPFMCVPYLCEMCIT